jgi:S1-C subfamily serine protease
LPERRSSFILKPVRKLLSLACVLAGCGGAAETSVPVKTSAPPVKQAAEEPARRGPVASLDRSEVMETVNAGLGRFLQRVDVEPALHDGRFTGFRIVELYPEEWWAGVDLAPGDVVTQINGMPIERETQAYAAFESLRSARELRVSFVRDGQPRELLLPIVESGSPKPPEGSPAPGGGGAG